jgi:tripartite-type tricarboxylate transporter receptor subunit TctC
MKISLKLIAAGLLVATAAAASAQQLNSIRWVVPYPAGGGADATARIIAEELKTGLNQSIVVDNRPGGATNIGVEIVKSAEPDGSTVGTADNASLTFNEHLFSNLSYDPKRDFSYIGTLARVPLVLVAPPGLAANNVAELLRLLRGDSRNSMSYGSVGVGSAHHIGMELFKSRTKTSITHVAYRGSAQAVPDLVGGRVQIMFLELPAAGPLIRANKIKALGVASAQRTNLLPDVPTLVEQGIQDFEIYGFMGMIGPANMPAPEVARINKALQHALQTPSLVQRFSKLGIEPAIMSPDDFYRFARAESERWGQVIRSAGIKIE